MQDNIDIAFAACNNNIKAFPYIGKSIQKEIEIKLNNCIDNFDIIENSMNPKPLDEFTLFFDVVEIVEE